MVTKDVIRALKVGDQQAFELVFREYSRALFFTAIGLINDRDVAENAVQETFVYLWEHRCQLDENQSLGGYLHIRLKHYILNHLRHEKIMRAHEESIIREQEFLNEEDEDMTSLMEDIRKQIDALPESCRKIFVMAVIEGMSYGDTAQALGVSVNTVKSQVKIGYRKIKDGLKHQIEDANLFALICLAGKELL